MGEKLPSRQNDKFVRVAGEWGEISHSGIQLATDLPVAIFNHSAE